MPADVDVLVAGFSCVDFSKLNKHAKELEDVGESGDTFRAILEYAKRYRPAMIILENVDGAPWDLIEAIWKNDRQSMQRLNAGPGFREFWAENEVTYSAGWVRVDAKLYYIPQTRIRRYMICLDRLRFPSPSLADDAVRQWKTHMKSLERKASAPVEAFLLSEDDPRLQYAKDEMAKTGKLRRETDWEVCQGRHEDYRSKEELGTSRSILNWTNDGSAKACSYLWTDWVLSQVERIMDTIEISYLRNAAKGIDSFYKSRFWELSQNVDRFLDTTPEGVIGCLTPKGLQFSTIRGRPITGLEAIALQGLPIDTLLLTRESQKELIDLGGNAMTSTAVGAAILSGLIVSHSILTRPMVSTAQQVSSSGPVSTGMRFSELGEKQALRFDHSNELSLEGIRNMAKASVSLCHCEGQSLTASALIRKCKNCNHHCCEKCGNMPKHNFVLLGGTGIPVRTEPQEFRKRVESALPTRLEIDGFPLERLNAFAQLIPETSEQDWNIFCDAILLAFSQEYRYESVKRAHRWTITYKAPGSRLELIFDQKAVHWLLYGQPSESETGNSPVRKLLAQPLARMTVLGQNMQGHMITSPDLLKGCWEIRLPITQTFPISITPQGQMTDSWEKKLGLQSERFVEQQVCTSLHVARILSPGDEDSTLGHELFGDYDLLENCGTARSSLHKKKQTVDHHRAPLFFFLDADRNGSTDQDCFVFSTEKHRLEYGESRYVAAKIENQWRPPYKGSDREAEFTVIPQVECTISSQWELCTMSLRPHHAAEEASLRFPEDEISMPVFGAKHNSLHASADDVYGCQRDSATTAFVSCEIPGQLADSIGWQVAHWTVMDQRSERQVAAAFAWLFARVKGLGGFDCGWRSLESPPRDYQRCLICAPKPPRIMWTCSRGGRKDKIIPYEDGREAANFERRIKARPAPFLVKTCIDDDEKHTGRLLVGLHLPTLVHRALARLNNIADSDDIDLQWRLDTAWEAPTRYRLRDFTLTNNKLNSEANYTFPTGEQLRPEQKRSLHWMIGQEADDMAFYEEEVEEAVLSQLSWRAEVRVRRTQIVRGGILADEVGYGKTATTLALVDAQKDSAEDYADYENSGCISVKATLILVPPHLIYQWKGQARKFLGIESNDERILVIDTVMQLAKVSVHRIKQALIVLVSWQVLSSQTYMTRMSHLAALPMGPSSGGREIEAWLTRACENIEKHTTELVNNEERPAYFAEMLKYRLKAAHNDETILRDVPTQRLKGAKYASWNPAETVESVDSSPKEEDLDKFFKHMTVPGCNDLDSLTGILFHMFDFYRVVVDEYTYVDENQQVDKLSSFITTIKARSRWVLSGTPSIQDFGDVHNLARYLACNLGVVDDAAGVLKGASIKHIRDHRTAAEQFRAFGFAHTAAWHISRQAHAQEFLDKYASKNVPEIGLIKSELHLRPHSLGAAETIPYAELQQQLQSSDMQIVLQGKTKKDSDRLRRLQALLKGCKTAPECLIKACAFFELRDRPIAHDQQSEDPMDVDDSDATQSEFDEEMDESPDTAAMLISGTSQSLIAVREKEMDALLVDLEHNLLHAGWLELQCKRAPKMEHKKTHFRRWMSEIETVGLKDPEANITIRDCLATALTNVDDDTEDMFYRDPPTAEDLKNEKKAADERKKRDKAKRVADRKVKEGKGAPRKRKAEEVASDSESDQADDVDPHPSAPKPEKIGKDNFETYVIELRNLTAHLRALAADLTSRIRSLRFARGAQKLQQWHVNPKELPKCEGCRGFAHDPTTISINIRCGHITCAQCIEDTGLAVCAVNGCGEDSGSYRQRKAADLVGDGKTWEYGSRLGNIIELIESLPDDEQVLLFVQFEDVMLNMAQGLEDAGISNYALAKSTGRKMVEMMNDFQDNDGEDKKKVLLLNPSSETASGINLTNANHVIFASPLLTNTQQSYDALMTQSIGRAKRYGQQNTVHVYRFVALKTADVDILQEREDKTLVKKTIYQRGKRYLGGGPASRRKVASVEWKLVSEDAIDESMEDGWGSGYDFKSNPNEDDA